MSIKDLIKRVYIWLYTSWMAIKLRGLISRPLRFLLKKILTKKVTVIKNDFKNNGKPTIYLANHGFYEDIKAVISSIEDNVTLLIGVEGKANTPSFVEKLALFLNGYIQINRKYKESKQQGFDSLVRILKNKGNILVFPEAIWNLTPNLLMLKLHWGALRMAEQTGANIVPVTIDVLKDGYGVIVGNCFNQYSSCSSRLEAVTRLRDIMATMVWELMEEKEPVKREEITEQYWVDHNRRELSGFPKKDWHTEEGYGFKPNGEIGLGEILAELNGIEYRSIAASYIQYLKVEKLIEKWNKLVPRWNN